MTVQNQVTDTTRRPLDGVWAFMDRVYLYCGYLAGLFLVCIFLTTILQVASRFVGINIRGLTDYAGYFMAASAFLAFPHTFNRGAHIRIELFLSMMGPVRIWVERLAFLFSTGVAVWLAYFSWSMVYWSGALNDVSQGMDATPLWLPQLSMAFGLSLLAVAIIDHSLRLLLTGHHQIPASPDAL
jgi:TRAP-type C4-dicarboxylate transport system permease small subunit